MADPDRSNETTIEGRVEILGDFPQDKLGYRNGMKRGVKHCGLFLKTKNGRLVIQLGPTAFFLSHNCQIKVGDTLKVKGFQVSEGKMTLVQASEVKTRGKKLKLRDKNGLPLWPAALDRTN